MTLLHLFDYHYPPSPPNLSLLEPSLLPMLRLPHALLLLLPVQLWEDMDPVSVTSILSPSRASTAVLVPFPTIPMILSEEVIDLADLS
jgi:hypothetical protein